MKPIFWLLTATIALGLLAAPAAAQPNATNATTTPTATATTTPSPTPTATPTATPASSSGDAFDAGNVTVQEEATIHLDSDVSIQKWEFSDGAFRIRFEADSPTFVTLTESTQQIAGSSTIAIKKERLLTGTNDVVVPIEKTSGEAAIVITSSKSVDDGRGIVLSTGISDGSLPFENTTSTAGWIGGAGTMSFLFIAVAWRAKRKQPDAPRSAD